MITSVIPFSYGVFICKASSTLSLAWNELNLNNDDERPPVIIICLRRSMRVLPVFVCVCCEEWGKYKARRTTQTLNTMHQPCRVCVWASRVNSLQDHFSPSLFACPSSSSRVCVSGWDVCECVWRFSYDGALAPRVRRLMMMTPMTCRRRARRAMWRRTHTPSPRHHSPHQHTNIHESNEDDDDGTMIVNRVRDLKLSMSLCVCVVCKFVFGTI